jgi:tetratricopeptide (TPR) repeat protein
VELEHTSSHVSPSPATGENTGTVANNSSSSHLKTKTHDSENCAPGEEKEQDDAPAPVHGPDDLSVFLGKGQALLSLGQAEAALDCFNEAIKSFPDEAEIFVKKGSALEKLEQWDEAIECYDRAIALKNDLTLAYLFKGGVCNRMERYNEALVCYEQALKTQHRPGSKTA